MFRRDLELLGCSIMRSYVRTGIPLSGNVKTVLVFLTKRL